MDFDVYEHGIRVWDGDPAPLGLAVLATTRLPIYSYCTVTVVDQDGTSLNERASKAVPLQGPYRMIDYFQEHDLDYSLRGALYHLDRIIWVYVMRCGQWDEVVAMDSLSGNIGDDRIYYEIDALLAAARRTYDRVSNLLWKHYAPPGAGGRWDSVTKALESRDFLPQEVIAWLRHNWNEFGAVAKDYRDCLMHNAPLHNGTQTLWMNRYSIERSSPSEADRWGATVRIPVPGAMGRRSYDLDNGPDALKYCHGLITHLVELCEETARLEPVATYLANPPRL